MAVYFQATIEVRAAGFAKFMETIARVVELAEGAGWELVGAYVQRSGRLQTVIDIWKLEDFNHFDRGMQALRESPQFAEIGAALAETVERETIVFLDAAPYFVER